MDIKSKSSNKIRTLFAVLAILIVTVCNIYIFPQIGVNAEKEYEKLKDEEELDSQFMNELQQGCYVLYYENTQYEGANPDIVRDIVADWAESFERYRNMVDYYAKTESKDETNTPPQVGLLLGDVNPDAAALDELRSQYQCYFTMKYDENGELSIENVWSQDGREDEIVKALLQAARRGSFASMEPEEYGTEVSGYAPRNFQVVYGIPKDVSMASDDYWQNEYWGRLHSYSVSGSSLLYAGSLAVLVVVLLLLTSNQIWRGTVEYGRRGRLYLMEAAILGIIGVISILNSFVEMNVQYVSSLNYQSFLDVLKAGTLDQVVCLAEIAGLTGLIYSGWYLSLLFLRPVFSLGPKEYIRQYSLVYLICTKGVGWIRRYWNKTKEEITHVDFSNKTIKTIRKIVVLNFLILAALSFFWFFGIFALAVYSVLLFFLMKKQYDKMEKDYQSLMQATARIAQGELEYEDTEDWGVFEPFKIELAKIRSGFSKAVDEEVKSQRMKTELITNVSHDLKTPLTAITTYIELLKEPDITEEQRRSYIEVLEKKSLQLKVLVEDLFEVSKATSNTIKLDLMEVDVVNLLKQVCVEHESKFQEMGLEVKWKLPKEKLVWMLDNQKTYRIFENLFINIEKYAMPGSRVYVEADRPQGPDGTKTEGVDIIIKNMSAQELSVSGEEITERFVRGDFARATEGSGLGLAIAKSFTQAQKGELEVTVDGDLFKVRISFV